MATRRTSWTREVGTALAVLAIYLLTMLAPLHQARASQVGFEALGYTTLDAGWVVCTALGTTGTDRDLSTTAKCPAAGIGKTNTVAPAGAALPVRYLQPLRVGVPVCRRAAVPLPPPFAPLGQRAPPVLI